MSPVLCAAAMGLSDLIVIGNALRLLRWGWETNADLRHAFANGRFGRRRQPTALAKARREARWTAADRS